MIEENNKKINNNKEINKEKFANLPNLTFFLNMHPPF